MLGEILLQHRGRGEANGQTRIAISLLRALVQGGAVCLLRKGEDRWAVPNSLPGTLGENHHFGAEAPAS